MTKSHDPLEIEALAGLPRSESPQKSRLPELLRELDCAEAMIGLANIAGSMETFQRNYQNTRATFDRALSLLEDVRLSGEMQVEISKRLNAIYRWLEVVGPTFEPR